jgi:hypothetical protein
VRVPAVHEVAIVYDGVDVFVCVAESADGLPLVFFCVGHVDFYLFVAGFPCVRACQFVHATIAILEWACAPAEVEIRMLMRWIAFRRVELRGRGVDERYIGKTGDELLFGAEVVSGAGVAESEDKALILLQVEVEGVGVYGQVWRDALEHPAERGSRDIVGVAFGGFKDVVVATTSVDVNTGKL